MSELDDLPAARPLGVVAREAQRSALENAIAAGSATRRRWAVPGAAIVCIAALAAATTGAAALVHRTAEHATDKSRIRCYSSADIGTDSSFRGTDAGMAQAAGDQTPPDPDPIDLCTALWRMGSVQPGVRNAQPPDGGEHPVPPLVACRLDNGIAAVFPGDSATCDLLQLPPLAR